MAFADDPVWLDTKSLSGAEMRRAEAMNYAANGTASGSLGGIRPGDPGLKASNTGMTWSVAAGVAAVPYPGQGVYRACSTSTVTGGIATAHASLQRLDLLYLRVWDNAVDASGLAQADIVYLAGTAGSGSLPSPSGTVIWTPLAQITVPAGSTNPSITDLRPAAVAPGGMPPVPSSGLATAGLYTGAQRYNLVRGCPEYWNGAAWVAQGDWTAYTPVWTAATTNPALGNGSLVGHFTTIGRTLMAKIELTTGSSTTYGSGTHSISIPATSSGAGSGVAVGSGHGINGTVRWDLGVIVTSSQAVMNISSPVQASNCAHALMGSGQSLGGAAWASGMIIRAEIAVEMT